VRFEKHQLLDTTHTRNTTRRYIQARGLWVVALEKRDEMHIERWEVTMYGIQSLLCMSWNRRESDGSGIT
jgi:hypothetical protein